MDNNEHNVIELIREALNLLNAESDTNEDGRTKSITITKLQEALLWASHIYNPIQNE